MSTNTEVNPDHTGTHEVTGRWQKAILHLDMDAFFVNVYLLEHPEDAGKPLAVGGRPESRGVVASASYEARQYGVHSAMASSQAVRLCPGLKIVGHNWSMIRDCSNRVMEILAEYGPIERMSVDEAYVDLSDQPDPETLVRVIQDRIRLETSLPASVGLSSGKLVAKVASDFDKPEGCTIVRPGSEAAFLEPLPVTVILGIGPRTAEKLAREGISTCGELAAYPPEKLAAVFGSYAKSMQKRARGIDHRAVQSERGMPKSISQEWTFDHDVSDSEILHEQLRKQAASVSRSLRKRSLVAHTVRVKFRWADFTTFTRQKSFEIGVDEEDRIYRMALAIWNENWPKGQKVRLIGVGVSGLEEATIRQFDLGI